MLTRFRRNVAGATAIEYGLVAALVCVVIISAISGLGDVTGAMYNKIGTAVTGAMR